ncbi:MAG TPA: hypothetical protein EYP43_00870, partial [Thermoplasmata archaeon]|nr:hypothetical protein [Thermoplasmata archaeon]
MSFVDTGMNGQGIIHPGRTRGSKGVVHVFGVITLALLASLLLLCATGPASADVNVTRVEVTPTMREVEPGGVGTYFVTIDVNVSGGAADVTAEVNNGTGEWNGWDAWIVGHGQTRTWYNVSGDRTWHLTINISVPSVADVDSNPFVATLSVTPTSGEANNVSWETRVRQVHAISVEPDWTALYVDRGEQAIYDLNISNLGNGEDTVTIEYRTNSSDIDLAGPGTRTISVGGNAIVSLYATTHEWTEPGAHTIDVVVTSEDNVTVASVQLELTVNATYGIRLWSPASIKTGGFGENVTFGLNVENRGDGSDLAHLV